MSVLYQPPWKNAIRKAWIIFGADFPGVTQTPVAVGRLD